MNSKCKFSVAIPLFRLLRSKILNKFILSNYVRSILFCWDKHVCTKVHCCKNHVKPKTCTYFNLFSIPQIHKKYVRNW